ncbi:MAG TPA: hypothetical protein V6C58_15220 [Allocoleopsis sp.]
MLFMQGSDRFLLGAIAFCVGDRFLWVIAFYGRSLFCEGDRFLCGVRSLLWAIAFYLGRSRILFGAIVFMMGDRFVMRAIAFL